MEFVPFSDKGKATKSPRNLKSSSNICKSAQAQEGGRTGGLKMMAAFLHHHLGDKEPLRASSEEHKHIMLLEQIMQKGSWTATDESHLDFSDFAVISNSTAEVFQLLQQITEEKIVQDVWYTH